MRIKKPDNKNAMSIMQAAQRDMEFTLSLPVNSESSATVIRNIYESFRMLGEAILVSKGFHSEDHLGPINELLKLHVHANRPINVIDNLRRLRHRINYYGYRPKKAEVEDAIDIARIFFKPLANEISKKVTRKTIS